MNGNPKSMMISRNGRVLGRCTDPSLRTKSRLVCRLKRCSTCSPAIWRINSISVSWGEMCSKIVLMRETPKWENTVYVNCMNASLKSLKIHGRRLFPSKPTNKILPNSRNWICFPTCNPRHWIRSITEDSCPNSSSSSPTSYLEKTISRS